MQPSTGSLNLSSPLVSILLPIYGTNIDLESCIKSVRKQSFEDWELLLCVFNVSEEVYGIALNSTRIDSRIKMIMLEGPGIPFALNEGIKMSSDSIYIARIDADDLMLPDRLKRQVRYLESNPDCVVVGGQRVLINQSGGLLFNKSWYPIFDHQIRSKWLVESPFAHPAVLIRKEPLKRLGGYRENFIYAEDRDLWFRLLEIGKGHNLPHRVLIYRTKKNTVTGDLSDETHIPWRYIPWIAWTLTRNQLPENLELLNENALTWLKDSVIQLLSSPVIKKWDRKITKQIAYNFQILQHPALSIMGYRLIQTKLLWRLRLPILFLRYAIDKNTLTRLSRGEYAS